MRQERPLSSCLKGRFGSRLCGNAKCRFDVRRICSSKYRAALCSRNQSVEWRALGGTVASPLAASRSVLGTSVHHAPTSRIALIVRENPKIAITRLRL